MTCQRREIIPTINQWRYQSINIKDTGETVVYQSNAWTSPNRSNIINLISKRRLIVVREDRSIVIHNHENSSYYNLRDIEIIASPILHSVKPENRLVVQNIRNIRRLIIEPRLQSVP